MSIVAVEACSESAKVLEFIEAPLDPVTLLVEILAVLMGALYVGARWDDDFHPSALQVAAQRFTCISFVRQQSFGFEAS